MKIETSEHVYPLLSLKDIVVFPHTIIPLLIENEKVVQVVSSSFEAKEEILVCCRKQPMPEEASRDDIYQVGVCSTILQLIRLSNGTIKVFIEGKSRQNIKNLLYQEDRLFAEAEPFIDFTVDDRDAEALRRLTIESFKEYCELYAIDIPSEVIEKMESRDDPGVVSDIVVSYTGLKTEKKQEILEDNQIESRLEHVYEYLQSEIEIARIQATMKEQVKQRASAHKKGSIFEQAPPQRAPMENTDDEVSSLEKQLKAKNMPVPAREKAFAELKRLELMPSMSAEATVIRSYIDWFLALPWNDLSEDKKDIKLAHQILEEDHYGLRKVKERILEYLAVQHMVGVSRGPILCLVGPPGVGKTSLGRSIARAVGRKFVRVSLGGVRDEAEIKGHRRTYIGAMPGKIIQGIRRAGTSNPVFLLDEVDKMSVDFRGDPSAALLEALDPEQNSAFCDHYMDVDYDVSRVMFVTTANTTYSIPAPLLDRMELIQLEGYTSYEKMKIAARHILPKQLKLHGLEDRGIVFSSKAVSAIIHEYTREAGVRNMEKEISSICRKIVKGIVSGGAPSHTRITKKKVGDLLGVPRFRRPVRDKKDYVGQANGLAWTEAGGVLLTVETTVMPGKGTLLLTGKMGDVMQESAQAGMSYVRSRAKEFGLDADFYNKLDIHIHIPEGAVPKDGPSAGITMATSIVSALTCRSVKGRLAMTGELTLGGRVLPVGGLKEKLLAAKEAGMEMVLVPIENEKDLQETPKDILRGMQIHLVEHMDQIIAYALN
ncbi:MAG TPA: endopeptidase La [Deltaproteobacteria bacterium]|nr:endopeptidase La [Deltaproteobacteria bacterium]